MDYAQFYGDLGVEMSELGLGYSEILQASVAGVVIVFITMLVVPLALGALVVFVFLAVVFGALAARFVTAKEYEFTGRRGMRDLIRRAPRGHYLARAFTCLAGAYVIGLGVMLTDAANDHAARVHAGERVEPVVVSEVLVRVPLAGDFLVEVAEEATRFGEKESSLMTTPVLNVKAEPARIRDLERKKIVDQCALFLGQAQGSATFFNPQRGDRGPHVMRFPSSRIKISTPGKAECGGRHDTASAE